MNRLEEIRGQCKAIERIKNEMLRNDIDFVRNLALNCEYLLSEVDRLTAELEEAKSETKSIFDVSIDHESAIEENYKSIIEKLTAELEQYRKQEAERNDMQK